jgi:hypothetical protein
MLLSGWMFIVMLFYVVRMNEQWVALACFVGFHVIVLWAFFLNADKGANPTKLYSIFSVL